MTAPNSNFYQIKANADTFYSIYHDTTTKEDGDYSNYVKWRWFWQSRVPSLDSSVNGTFQNYQTALTNFIQYPICNGSPLFNNPWSFIGPSSVPNFYNGNEIGRVTAIAKDPNNSNIVYSGSPTGGLFKTTNFNDANPVWTNMTENAARFPGLGINDIAINPSNTNIIYIATGIYDYLFGGLGVYGSGYGSGILKSTNGGVTWTIKNPTYLVQTDIAYRIKLNPQNPNIVYALISDKCFKSTDGGDNWTISKQLLPSTGLNGCAPGALSRFFREIQFKPDDPNTIYCSTDDAPCGVVYQTNGNDGAELWKTTNGGTNWSKLTPSGTGGTHCAYLCISVCKNAPSLLWVAYKPLGSGTNGNTTIKKSTDGGNTWTTISNSLNFSYFANTDRYVFCVSPYDQNTIYISDVWLAKSINGGVSFNEPPIMHVDTRTMCFLTDNQSPDIFCAGNDGGIIYTSDGGNSYQSKCGVGLSLTQFYGIGISSTDNIAGGTLDNDVLVRTNGIWMGARSYEDASDQLFDPLNPNIFYSEGIGAWPTGAFYNMDKFSYSNGTWSPTDISPPDNNSQVIRPMEIVNGFLYVGYHDIYKSTTPNISWTKISHFSTDFSGIPSNASLTGIAVAPSNPQIIYATYGGWAYGNHWPTFFKSINGGSSWVDFTNNLPTNAAQLRLDKIIVDPSNPDNVWIAVGGIANNGTTGNSNGDWRVIMSTHGGSNWENYSKNLPEFPVNTIIYQKGSNGGLYVGTDVGVYYTNNQIYSTYGWICYNQNMPTVMVTDLDIDYCSNKLFASTFGRGTWQCDLVTSYPGPILQNHIYSNTTISSPTLQENDIVIESGATLTVTSQINFQPFVGIIVKPGATLVLNGGTLTSACQGLWKGIEVWGNYSQSQYVVNNVRNQGFVNLIGGTISNSIDAIRLWHPYDYFSSGGIVQANGTNFINNRRATEFISYHNFNPYNYPSPNLSYFKNCQFSTNTSYYGPNPFSTFISMWDVEGINIIGCNFQNSTPLSSDPNPPSRGSGIYSMDAAYTISSSCHTTNIDPCPSPIPTSFQGLSFGINASSYGNLKSVRVFDANFIDNDRSIYFSAQNYSTIVNNHFYIGTDNICPNQTGIGVELVNSSGYSIENNNFTHSNTLPSGNWYIGICVKHPLSYPIPNDIIYRNTFDRLNVGNQAEGYNFDLAHVTGLSYYCNVNTSNVYDFYVPDEGILMFQGSNLKPAGNKFSHNYNPNIPGSDFTRIGNWPVFYYYYNNSQNSVEQPWYISGVYSVGTSYQNTCPSNYNTTGNQMVLLTQNQIDSLSQVFADNSVEYDNTVSVFNALKDGGNTQVTNLEVLTATDDKTMQLRDTLLGMSPHLSEEVLKSAIDRYDVLPDAILLEILSANPDETRNGELMDYLKKRTPPFPDYMVTILDSIASDSTYKTRLLQIMTSYQLMKSSTAYQLIRNSLNDSIVDMTSVRNWLDNQSCLNADYQIIDTWIQEGNYTAAAELLNLLPGTYNLTDSALIENNYFNSLKTLQINLITSGRNIFQLDTNEISTLANIASISKGIAGTQAANILQFAYGYSYPQCAVMVTNPTKSFKIKNNDLINKLSDAKIKAYPNPANNWTAFYYELPELVRTGSIEISDIKGHNIKIFMINNQKGEIIWDTREIIAGEYLYTCKFGNKLKSGKLIINH